MDHSLYYLQEFKKYISLQTGSPNTIKNYLSDLRLFLFFITTNQHLVLDPEHLPAYINEDFISRYNDFLSVTNPPATAKRRISSLKKFIDYCATQGIHPASLNPAPSITTPTSTYIPPVIPHLPVIPESPEPSAYFPPASLVVSTSPVLSIPAASSLPDPENLVHDFIDLKPETIPVTPQPTSVISSPDSPSNSYLPVILSLVSFLLSFGLTLLIHMLLTR